MIAHKIGDIVLAPYNDDKSRAGRYTFGWYPAEIIRMDDDGGVFLRFENPDRNEHPDGTSGPWRPAEGDHLIPYVRDERYTYMESA